MLTEKAIREIPTNTLALWAIVNSGINPHLKYSPNTYFKHRSILRAYGIDIEPEVRKLEATGS